jgi:hypothetical protein
MFFALGLSMKVLRWPTPYWRVWGLLSAIAALM